MHVWQGEVVSIAHGGLGIVHINQDTLHVRQSAVGDSLVLSEPQRRHGRLYADVQQVLEPSPQRVSPACEIAEQCGGCALQYIDSHDHAAIKSQWVHDAFQCAIVPDTQWQPVLASVLSASDNCRRRLRWHVSRLENGEVILGFRGYQSHHVIGHQSCMVVTDELNSLHLALQTSLAKQAYLPIAIYAVQLFNGIHIVFEYDEAMQSMPELPDWDAMPLQCWLKCEGITRPLHKPVLALHDRLPTAHGEIDIAIGANDFVQGQYAGNQHMIQQILQWCEGANYVVDLFSGVGNLSLPLAASGIKVSGAEVNAFSVQAANKNSKRLKLDAHYQQVDLFASFDVAEFVGADVLMIDPPRKGAKNICAMMNILLPKKVILVHCDVLSASRDANEMQKQGYHLQALRALDLFPYSGHVESMSLWAH
jgi:23S rRNA (uracil1939-C5)-methyltransferase